jgi:hypothetical protein
VAKLSALALELDQLVSDRGVKDFAELARLADLSRALFDLANQPVPIDEFSFTTKRRPF